MKRIVEIIKNNYKIVIGLILGILVSSISVYALENIAMIDSDEVDYDNSKSHGDYENVQETIDELYKKVGFTGDKWKDPVLDGADPVLSDGLIPVVISSKGDTYYANEYTRWYDYSQKRWANAVILVENTSKNYAPGDKIEEQDIESYFVWIPRYKYKVWDLGDYKELIQAESLTNTKDGNALHLLAGDSHLIDVVFGDTTHVTVGDDAKKSGTSGGNGVNVGEYLIHPAFTLGDTELNGIWVGKFETGYKGANSASEAQKTEQDSTKIIIKPDVYSWRYNTVKNFFMSAYNYKQDLKSHMMKNTEWGAVAYLSHSSYGIGTEVNVNNNSDFITGYSAAPGTDQGKYTGDSGTTEDKTLPWNTPTGYLASTTGNITGVYDMSGGAWEYVAGYRVGSHTNDKSGFTTEEEITNTYKDYVDVYDATSSYTSYDKRILGDATGELGPFLNYIEDTGNTFWHSSWYSDYSGFVETTNPWFRRGGDWPYGVMAGQFYFSRNTGDVYEYGGFRLALSISQ